MARLNEPPQPVFESIDALKRRFVRQNREIARANSNQSVRIRNLESEVSRLLGENVSLREENIQLHHEAEKNTGRQVLEGVDIVKGHLEAKLSEIGNLVQQLGKVRKNVDPRRAQKRTSIDRSRRRSSEQRIWKRDPAPSEVAEGADIRLPPIMEDKYYPRRTLDAEEILGIAEDQANLTDSPDFGPPPIAHFEPGDPISFDSSSDIVSNQGPVVGEEEAQPTLPANLETRRKRRESSYHKDEDLSKGRCEPTKFMSSKEATRLNQALKSGAKRKLNVREDEEGPEHVEKRVNDATQPDLRIVEPKSSAKDDAQGNMSRAGKSVNSKASHTSSADIHRGREKGAEVKVTNVLTDRKALAPKSANSDTVNSPLKNRNANSKEKAPDRKDDRAQTVRERNRSKEQQQAKAVKQAETKEAAAVSMAQSAVAKPVEPPPETPIPAYGDLFSPDPSEALAPRAESRDTPPPPDLGADTGTGSFGRASRRPKGPVNYAQPNLRDKMRRPTAELVDAVAAEEQARRAKVKQDISKDRPIKQEDTTDSLPLWKTNEPKYSYRPPEESASPLTSKTRNPDKDLPPNVTTERRRRTVLPPPTSGEVGDGKRFSGVSSIVAALTSGNPKSKRNEEVSATDVTEDAEQHNVAEKSNIYDFTGSSPNTNHAEDITQIQEETAKPSRSSRRHSTVPASLDKNKGTLSISRRGERRREGSIGSRQEQSLASGLETASTRTKSVIELRDGGVDSNTSGGERAAGRRRSMML